jgi:hypothetical protein
MLSSCLLCFVWIPEINNFPIHSTITAQWRPYTMQLVKRWIHLMKVCWTLLSSDITCLCNFFGISIYQIYNFTNFCTCKQSLKMSWIFLCGQASSQLRPFSGLGFRHNKMCNSVYSISSSYKLHTNYKVYTIWNYQVRGIKWYTPDSIFSKSFWHIQSFVY